MRVARVQPLLGEQAGLDPLGEVDLLLGVQQRDLADLLQVVLDRVGGRTGGDDLLGRSVVVVGVGVDEAAVLALLLLRGGLLLAVLRVVVVRVGGVRRRPRPPRRRLDDDLFDRLDVRLVALDDLDLVDVAGRPSCAAADLAAGLAAAVLAARRSWRRRVFADVARVRVVVAGAAAPSSGVTTALVDGRAFGAGRSDGTGRRGGQRARGRRSRRWTGRGRRRAGAWRPGRPPARTRCAAPRRPRCRGCARAGRGPAGRGARTHAEERDAGSGTTRTTFRQRDTRNGAGR